MSLFTFSSTIPKLLLQTAGTPEGAAGVAEKLTRKISRPIQIDKEAWVSVDASIGISIYPDNGKSADELLRHADAAMYIAKSTNNLKNPPPP